MEADGPSSSKQALLLTQVKEQNSNEGLVGKEIVITVEEDAQEGVYQLAGMAS